MSYGKNPYYNPEALGLESVGQFDITEPDWSFDIFAVWRSIEDPTKFYWDTDSGCSCPAPFENFDSLEDLSSGDKHDVAIAIANYTNDYNRAEAVALIESVVSP